MIGEKFFNLTPRDDVSQRFIWVCERIQVPGGLGAFQAKYTVPQGRILVLHALSASAIPGGASAPTQFEFFINQSVDQGFRYLKRYNINNSGAALHGRLVINAALTVGAETSIDWTGELYLPQNAQVGAQVVWSGAGNNMVFDVHGILVNYGNMTI